LTSAQVHLRVVQTKLRDYGAISHGMSRWVEETHIFQQRWHSANQFPMYIKVMLPCCYEYAHFSR